MHGSGLGETSEAGCDALDNDDEGADAEAEGDVEGADGCCDEGTRGVDADVKDVVSRFAVDAEGPIGERDNCK